MARLPFDDNSPTDAPGPETPKRTKKSSGGKAASGGGGPWTVSQAAAKIKGAITDALPRKVRIVGEVSNFSDRNHWFFSLKEGNKATLRCVCFASSARRVPCRVRDGMEVVATGRIDFYDAQGSVQLYVDAIEPVGQGALELQLRQLLKELREAGYFEPAHKKKLPAVPRRIAVVTSRSAAALQDVIDTKSRRFPGVQLLHYDVRVQGAQAAPEVAAAIDRLTEHGARLGIDAVIVTRGGGSIEDLWAFNDRTVAEAIYRCPLPVVAAIGHETDTTVAELVADSRCATPTQAVAVLVPDRDSLVQQVDQTASRLALLLSRQLRHERQRLDHAAGYALFRRPGKLVERASDRLDQADQRLAPALRRRLVQARQRLDGIEKHLDAVGPHQVLQRGYTYTLGPDGKLLRSKSQASPGDRLRTVFHDGDLVSRVEDAEGSPPPEETPAKPVRRRKKKKTPPPEEPGLFGG